MRVYRIKLASNRYGRMWYAQPEPGFDKLLFPVMLGANTCAQAVTAAYHSIARAKARQRK